MGSCMFSGAFCVAGPRAFGSDWERCQDFWLGGLGLRVLDPMNMALSGFLARISGKDKGAAEKKQRKAFMSS